MAYCLTTDVQSEFKNLIFSASGAISISEVDEFILQEDAYINSIISCKFITPIIVASDILILKKVCILLVSERIKKILRVKKVTVEGSQDSFSGTSRADKMLKDICKGFIRFESSQIDDNATALYSDSLNASTLRKPVFIADCEQW
jgi:hypothetical protein